MSAKHRTPLPRLLALSAAAGRANPARVVLVRTRQGLTAVGRHARSVAVALGWDAPITGRTDTLSLEPRMTRHVADALEAAGVKAVVVQRLPGANGARGAAAFAPLNSESASAGRVARARPAGSTGRHRQEKATMLSVAGELRELAAVFNEAHAGTGRTPPDLHEWAQAFLQTAEFTARYAACKLLWPAAPVLFEPDFHGPDWLYIAPPAETPAIRKVLAPNQSLAFELSSGAAGVFDNSERDKPHNIFTRLALAHGAAVCVAMTHALLCLREEDGRVARMPVPLLTPSALAKDPE